MGEDLVAIERMSTLKQVEALAVELGKAEARLENGYAELAAVLLVVRDNRFWEGEFQSWNDYLKHVGSVFHQGNAQLYHKISTVEELQGVVETKDLTSMGITKASILANTHRAYGKLPSTKQETSIVDFALNPSNTAKDLRKEIIEVLCEPDDPKDEWWDGGYAFYVSPEERKEILDFERIMRQVDPPISGTLKSFMQKKEIFMRAVRECLGTYSDLSEDR